jgi:iron complex outermembrane recepter protein
MKNHLIIVVFLTINILSLHSAGMAGGVNGFVSDGETGMPMANVIIRISAVNKIFVSDSAGSFEIGNIPLGNYLIEFSHIGYKTETAALKIDSADNSCIVFRMYPLNIITPSVVVTAGKIYAKSLEISGHSKVVEGKELQQNLSQTIAATLKNEVGLSVTAMGAAPSRPVIRGLGGNRITFAEDGTKTGDLSGTSPDHAVAIDPFTAEKIEIVRGPKSLIGAGGSNGGVVNVVKENIPLSIPLTIMTEGIAFFESANTGIMGALKSEIPLNPFAIKGDISYRKAGDISSPGKTLKNTGIKSYSYSFGAGYRDNIIAAGAGIKEYSMEYGIPGGFVGAHPNGVKIEMFRRFYNSKIIIDLHKDILENIELNLSRNYYHHTEYESGNSIGAEFSMWNYTGDLQFNFSDFGNSRDLIAGISFESNDEKVGGYVFSPSTKSYNFSLYGYEDYKQDKWSITLGFRYILDFYNPYDYKTISKIGLITDREFASPMFSLSIMNDLSDNLSLGINFSRIARHPTSEELYSEGPHLAAYSYETGNPNLESERGWEFEIFGVYKIEDLSININLFLNKYDYFIVQRNTGKTNYSTLLPIYSANGEKSIITGTEVAAEYKITEELSISAIISYTYGELIELKTPLPMMPPLKFLTTFNYSIAEFETGLRSEIVSEQRRVDKFELPTSGYIIFSLYGQFIFQSGDILNSIALNIENLFNTEYRNHLSRIKSIMPEPGLNLRLIYKVFL